MSTRAYISLKTDKENARVIYCHSDGYLSHTGVLLSQYYNTPEKAKALIDVGDISYLGEYLNPDPSKPHNFEFSERQKDVTVAYGRDRGEDDCEAKTFSLKTIEDSAKEYSFEYYYLFDGEKWLYYGEDGWMSLSEALKSN